MRLIDTSIIFFKHEQAIVQVACFTHNALVIVLRRLKHNFEANYIPESVEQWDFENPEKGAKFYSQMVTDGLAYLAETDNKGKA